MGEASFSLFTIIIPSFYSGPVLDENGTAAQEEKRLFIGAIVLPKKGEMVYEVPRVVLMVHFLMIFLARGV